VAVVVGVRSVGAGPSGAPASSLVVVAALNIGSGGTAVVHVDLVVRASRLDNPAAAEKGSGAVQGPGAVVAGSSDVVVGSLVASAEDCWLEALFLRAWSPVGHLWLSSLYVPFSYGFVYFCLAAFFRYADEVHFPPFFIHYSLQHSGSSGL